jgi:hypothetical protein
MNRNMEVFNWDEEHGETYKSMSKYLYGVFKKKPSTKDDIISRLSLLITFYSALQSESKFCILKLGEHLLDKELPDGSNIESISKFIATAMDACGTNCLSLLTKYLLFAQGLNVDNQLYIYDSKVVTFLKARFEYRDKHKYCNRYTHFANAMKNLKDEKFKDYNNREMDLIIWNAVKYAEKHEANMGEFLKEDIRNIVEKLKNVPNK